MMKQISLGLPHLFDMHFCHNFFFLEKDLIFSHFLCFTNYVDTSVKCNHENPDYSRNAVYSGNRDT